jgi:branched-chain amino acid transport system permease protein
MTNPPGGEARIGVDQWVEQSDERREQHKGWTAPARRAFDQLTPGWRLALVAAAAAAYPFFVRGSDVRIGISVLLLAMLALGLNVVVGWAGLLDLGYIAFYGFGAYFYAIVASDHLPAHWPTEVAIPVIVLATGILGVILSLPSRRLVGDYLAIMTLFFSQIFLELVINFERLPFNRLPFVSEDLNLTGGSNGIPGVEDWQLFGYHINTFNRYYYLSLALVVLLIIGLHNIDKSRTGRAWRALREDTLAAEHMTTPVNTMKMLAFAVGAAIAGLTGTIFAAVQVGVFPANFELLLLITIYAAVILGGSGSLSGVVLGAVVVAYVPEVLRDPSKAGWLFYGGLVVVLILTIKPWQRVLILGGGLVGFGFLVRAVASNIWDESIAGTASGSFASRVVDGWVLILDAQEDVITNYAFVATIAGFLAVTLVKGWWRIALLIPTIYLAVLVWENKLVDQTSVTRQLLFGGALVVMMAVRPQGLLGTRRVEIL